MLNAKKILVFLAMTMLIALLPTASAVDSQFEVNQGTNTYSVVPIEGSQDAVSFYDYDSSTWSGYTPFMKAETSKVYLYKDTNTGDLSLIMHHGVDNGDPVDIKYNVKFNLDGLPQGAYVAVSDDPALNGNPAELSLSEGDWTFDAQKVDGGVISGLPAGEDWCITIEPTFGDGIKSWEYVSQTTDGYKNISLDMGQSITICDPAPKPAEQVPVLTPVGLIALFGGLLVVALVMMRKQ